MTRYHLYLFARGVDNFKKNGFVKMKGEGRPTSKKPHEANQVVQQEVERSPLQIIQMIAKKLNFGK